VTSGLRQRLSCARATLAEAPRHVVLAALVGGLLAGPLSGAAVAATAALFALAPASAPLAAAGVGAVILGGGIAESRADAIDHGPAERLHGRVVAGKAVVLEPPRRRPRGVSVARVRLIDGPAAGDAVVLRIRHAFTWPPVGGEIAYRGAAGAVDGPETWQARRGAHALVDATSARATGGRRGGPAGVLDAIRVRATRALAGDVPLTEGALLRGMVLGDDADVPDDLRSAFEVTSLAHLLAVSGQNVVLLASLVAAAGTALGAGLRGRLAAALGAVLLYVPLTGAGASIQRAGVMGAAGLVAAMAGRPASRWYAVGLAAAVTLAWNPYAVADVAWQLSFAAVIAMLVGVPPLREALRRARLPGALADVLAVTLAATLGPRRCSRSTSSSSRSCRFRPTSSRAGSRPADVARHDRRRDGPAASRARRAPGRAGRRPRRLHRLDRRATRAVPAPPSPRGRRSPRS
jgi:competence protein ComEC